MTPKIRAALARQQDCLDSWLEFCATPPRHRFRRRRLLRDAEAAALRYMQMVADCMAEAGWSPGENDGER